MKNYICTFFLFLSIPICSQSNWVPLNSPGGADVNNIFKVNDSIFVCGIQEGSLYRSSNYGQDWTKVFSGNNSNANTGVRKMIFNSNNDILVGTFQNGILFSSDCGLNWLETNCGGGEQIVSTQSGLMFSYDNVHLNWSFAKSLDSGYTWSYVPVPWVIGWHEVNSMVSVADTIYIGIDDSIVCTKDFGSTWERYGNRISGSNRINQIIFINEVEVILGTPNGIYFSSDRGITWQIRNNGIASTSKVINNLIIHNESIYACTYTGIYRTTDKGNQWNHINNSNFQINVKNLVPMENYFFVVNQAGVYKVEPNDWVNYSNGIYKMTPLKISSTNNSDIVYSSSTGIFKSTDFGNEWYEMDLNTFGINRGDFISKDNYYVIQKSEKFYLSTDFGLNWFITGNLVGSIGGMSFLPNNYFIFDAYSIYQGPYLPPAGGIRYSTDFGVSWINCNHIASFSELCSSIRTLPNNLVFCSVYDRFNYQSLGFYRTENLGLSWIESNYGLPDISLNAISVDKLFNLYAFIDGEIYKLNKTNFIWEYFAEHNLNNITYITYNKNNHFIAINNNKIFISTNGIKWYPSIGGLENVNIKIVESDSLGFFYAADNGGRIYKTLTPHLINQFPSAPELLFPVNNQQIANDTIKFVWNSSDPLITKYKFIISEDSLFGTITDSTLVDTTVTIFNLKTNLRYFWKVSAYNEVGWGIESEVASFITGLTDVEEAQIIPDKFVLLQNYPNPFNPSTNISWQSPVAGWQTLKVYDILGNEVAVLVNEYRTAGSYEIDFNATKLSSGVYYYQLKAGDFIQTKKMIMLK